MAKTCAVVWKCGLAALLAGVTGAGAAENMPTIDQESIDRGRYLIRVGGCNDCHTPGFMQAPYSTPETEWLTGTAFGWRGPWGTSYPSNLRISVHEYPEDAWVLMTRTRTMVPPMPWHAVNAWTDPDARAVYRYIKSLGLKGEKAPTFVPPGEEPATPYFDMTPKNLPQP